jgi:SpoVK/Ycf46/Vps4 family AAA+-type ATPase
MTFCCIISLPGNGKTEIVKALATKFEYKLIQVHGANLKNHLVGKSEKNVARAFEYAVEMSPSILLFDEVIHYENFTKYKTNIFNTFILGGLHGREPFY